MNDLDMSVLTDISQMPGYNGEEIKVYEPLELVDVESNANNRAPDLEADYVLVRKQMHYQSQMLFDISKIALENAKNSDSPRYIEVFATLMNQVSNTHKDLLRLHKDMKDITDEKTTTKGQGGGELNINNAQVFVGSPTDMMDKFGDAFTTRLKQQEIEQDGTE